MKNLLKGIHELQGVSNVCMQFHVRAVTFVMKCFEKFDMKSTPDMQLESTRLVGAI